LPQDRRPLPESPGVLAAHDLSAEVPRMKRILAVSLVLTLLLTAGIVHAQTPVPLKLATIVGPDSAFSTSAVKFKELAEAKSGGKLKIEVYPGGALAKNENVMLEGFQLGTI